MVFTISPTVVNLHEFGDSFRLLTPEFFDVGFSSDAITESIDCPINKDIFGSIQKFGEAPDI
jgi:hypothetical protein